jgi:hypothetical protein
MIRLTLVVVVAMGLVVLNGGTGFLAKLFAPNVVSARSEIPTWAPGLAGESGKSRNPRGWREPRGFNGFNNRRDDD